MAEIFKIIFYNRFSIFAIILESEYILTFRSRNITDYLNDLVLYINEIILESDKKLQLIIKSREKCLLL
jgi:hypothetical protein